jgi:hypothetical protein
MKRNNFFNPWTALMLGIWIVCGVVTVQLGEPRLIIAPAVVTLVLGFMIGISNGFRS